MLDECIKKLKQAKELKIEYQEQDNQLILTAKGIITNAEILKIMNEGFDQIKNKLVNVNTRLDNLESDVAQIKQCPTIKHELNEFNDNQSLYDDKKLMHNINKFY